MIGCPVAWKCRVACRLGELSQHPTRPHSTHSRSSTQVPPLARQSWQPGWLTLSIRIWSRWVHSSAMGTSGWGREPDRIGERHAPGLDDQAGRVVEEGEEAGAGLGAQVVPGGHGQVVGTLLQGGPVGPAGPGKPTVLLDPAAVP